MNVFIYNDDGKFVIVKLWTFIYTISTGALISTKNSRGNPWTGLLVAQVRIRNPPLACVMKGSSTGVLLAETKKRVCSGQVPPCRSIDFGIEKKKESICFAAVVQCNALALRHSHESTRGGR